jgi:hypothetical protein
MMTAIKRLDSLNYDHHHCAASMNEVPKSSGRHLHELAAPDQLDPPDRRDMETR